jgi:hypothetical protein
MGAVAEGGISEGTGAAKAGAGAGAAGVMVGVNVGVCASGVGTGAGDDRIAVTELRFPSFEELVTRTDDLSIVLRVTVGTLRSAEAVAFTPFLEEDPLLPLGFVVFEADDARALVAPVMGVLGVDTLLLADDALLETPLVGVLVEGVLVFIATLGELARDPLPTRRAIPEGDASRFVLPADRGVAGLAPTELRPLDADPLPFALPFCSLKESRRCSELLAVSCKLIELPLRLGPRFFSASSFEASSIFG